MGKLSVSKKRNARHYERTATYLFTNKLKSSKCGSFLGGAASKKKSGKKYYYYKCEHCKTYYSEEKIEDLLLDAWILLQRQEELLNDYYTPFIKSKLENHTKDYTNELKEKEVGRNVDFRVDQMNYYEKLKDSYNK